MNFVLEVGFEPTHPKITELESAALDHSAIQAPHPLLIPDGIRTRNLEIRSLTPYPLGHGDHKHTAATRDRTGDLQIFSLTLSQLSYSGADDPADSRLENPSFDLGACTLLTYRSSD